MTNLILLLSKFNKQKKINGQLFNSFHFKGYYMGQKIEEIISVYENKDTFIKGDNYLIWSEKKVIQSGILEINILKSKKIN